MTPDELRALADAIVYRDSLAIARAADYLRAQADAHPALAVPAGWAVVPIKPTEAMKAAGGHVNSEWLNDDAPLWEGRYTRPMDGVWSAMLAAAPAAPQAEPKREHLSDEQIELPGYLRLQIAGTAAAHDVLVERRRQIEVEGWTPEHDDEHDAGALALAAAAYALDAGDKCSPYSQGDGGGEAPEFWPWTHGSGRHREARWWKPGTPRRNLVKAGALILAEIERLDRMGGSDGN